MEELLRKNEISSLELLKEINLFREQEGSPKTTHKDLMIIIETEFTSVNRKRVEGGVCPEVHALINKELEEEGIIQSSYIHPQNKQEYPIYILPLNKAKQCLLKESKFVRKAVIAYIEKLENKLKEQSQPKQMTMAEMFAMQANINLDYERRMLSVENRLNEIEKEREENAKALLEANISEERTPEMTMRDNIRQLVNQYANATNTRHNDVWHKVYQQLYYLYHISINAYKRGKGDSKLDIAEKNHFLDKIYNVVSNMVRELK